MSWDDGQQVLAARQLINVPPGSDLEAAIGLANLTALSGAALANEQGGCDSTATANA